MTPEQKARLDEAFRLGQKAAEVATPPPPAHCPKMIELLGQVAVPFNHPNFGVQTTQILEAWRAGWKEVVYE